MQMTFRWFGADDPVPLAHIRQIPGVRGIVSALYDVPVGETWPRDSVQRLPGGRHAEGARDSVQRLAAIVNDEGLALTVIESIPVHEDIKLGRPTRDRLIDNYAAS